MGTLKEILNPSDETEVRNVYAALERLSMSHLMTNGLNKIQLVASRWLNRLLTLVYFFVFCYLLLMTQSLLFSQATLARMVQVEMNRAQFFQRLADDRQDDIPIWLKCIQRVGIGGNLFYAKLSAHAKYHLAAAAMREFQRCVVKWSAADVDPKDHEIQLLIRLFSKVEIFSDGKFDVNKETLSLYNAAVLDVAKFFVLEAPVMNEVLRKNSVGTRVERNDIINALKEHWQEFRMSKKLSVII